MLVKMNCANAEGGGGTLSEVGTGTTNSSGDAEFTLDQISDPDVVIVLITMTNPILYFYDKSLTPITNAGMIWKDAQQVYANQTTVSGKSVSCEHIFGNMSGKPFTYKAFKLSE